MASTRTYQATSPETGATFTRKSRGKRHYTFAVVARLKVSVGLGEPGADEDGRAVQEVAASWHTRRDLAEKQAHELRTEPWFAAEYAHVVPAECR